MIVFPQHQFHNSIRNGSQYIYIFDFCYKCSDVKTRCSQLLPGSSRISTIFKSSEVYGDGLQKEMQNKIDQDPDFIFGYHKQCIDKYRSPKTMTWVVAKKSPPDDNEFQSPTKRTRSNVPGFKFKRDCIYCGGECNITKDERHPDRWRASFLILATKTKDLKAKTKAIILDKCSKYETKGYSEEAELIRMRVLSALDDLHAADARYHLDCRVRFDSGKLVKQINCSQYTDSANNVKTDDALNKLLDELKSNRRDMWTSISLWDKYVLYGGNMLHHRSNLISALTELCSDIVVLSANGYAKIVIFKDNAFAKLRKVNNDDEYDDLEKHIKVVAKHIKKESLSCKRDPNVYRKHIDKHVAREAVSDTLMKLLKLISPDLEEFSLPSLLIGNMVTSNVNSKQPTHLQIALSLLVKGKKKQYYI